MFLQVPPSPKCSLQESEANVTVPGPAPTASLSPFLWVAEWAEWVPSLGHNDCHVHVSESSDGPALRTPNCPRPWFAGFSGEQVLILGVDRGTRMWTRPT